MTNSDFWHNFCNLCKLRFARFLLEMISRKTFVI